MAAPVPNADTTLFALGAAAGLTTSLLWVFTSLSFTAAGHRIGPTVVNTIRIALAIALLGLHHRIAAGLWLPDASTSAVFYLAASGIIGLSIGDQALFTSFLYIGPRLATLLMTTSPIVAAALGRVWLDETIGPWGWLGILVTMGGVAWVVLERPRPTLEYEEGYVEAGTGGDIEREAPTRSRPNGKAGSPFRVRGTPGYVLGIGLAYGLQVMGDVQDDMTSNSHEYNATENAIQGVAKIPEKLPTIATVIVAAVIIGILVTYLWARFAR